MSRGNHLLISDHQLLKTWARDVRRMFGGAMPYLVGSCLERANFRDVDVRVMLDDNEWPVRLGDPFWSGVNLAVSLWGQKVTGLPIDFQVQRAAAANAEFDGPRHALGIDPR